MKQFRTTTLLLFLTLSVCMVSAQAPLTAGRERDVPQQINPPKVILDKFTKEYPRVTPSWRMDGQNFVAEFVDPVSLKGVSVVYDKEGNVVRKESEVENASYPQGINDYYIKKYPGEKFKTWSSLDDKGERRYFIRREKETVWFDQEGHVIADKTAN
jgi:hypothetical protein